MSNIIDSIQLSGTTYQIQGSGGGVPESAFTAYTAATDARIAEDEEVTAAALNELNEAISGISGNNVIELTQAEYDALVTAGTVDLTAFYVITDATAVDLTNYYTKSETNTLLNGKQATLVSGTNIKTINNESILGSGNIDIQGGGGISSGEVQTMIDSSISGKVNTTTYTAYTSSTQTTLNSKLNKSAVENSLNYWSTNPVQNKVLFNELNISGLTMDEENVDVVTIGANDWYDEGGDYECSSEQCPTYLRKVVFTISNDEHAYDTSTSYVGVRDTHFPYGDFVHVDFSYNPNDPEVPQEAWIDINSVDIYGDMFSGVTASASGTSITLEIPNIIYYDVWEQVYKEYEWSGDGIIWQMQMTDPETYEKLHVGTVTASASGAVVTYTPVKDAVEDVEESLSGKQDTLSAGTNITISGNVISASGGISSGEVQTMIDSSISGKVDTSAFTAYTASTESRIAEDEEVTAAGLNALNDKFDGLKLKKLTQAEYNALATKDASTLYIIVN